MESEQDRKWKSLRRSCTLLHSRMPDAPLDNPLRQGMSGVTLSDPRFAVALARLDALEATLGPLLVQQFHATNALPAEGGEIRQMTGVLRHDHLLPAVRFGKKLKLHRDVAGGKQALKVPHATATAEVMAAAGLELANWLKDFESEYHQAKWNKNFRARIRAASRALQKRARQVNRAKKERSASTAAISATIEEARLELAYVDALLKGPLQKDRPFRSVWLSEKRVWKKKGRPRRRRPPKDEGEADATG